MNERIKPAGRSRSGRWSAATLVGAVLTIALAAGTSFPAGAADAPKSGDADKGKKLYAKQNCDSCHTIGKKGGSLGPDLSKEGTKRDSEWLLAFLKNPRSKVPTGTMPTAKGSDPELQDLAAYLLTLR